MRFEANNDFPRVWANGPECLETLMEATDRIHDVFNAIAPRRTSDMVNSVVPEATKTPDGWQVELIVQIYYAKFVEAGTRYMRAQHNLRRSLEIVESESEN